MYIVHHLNLWQKFLSLCTREACCCFTSMNICRFYYRTCSSFSNTWCSSPSGYLELPPSCSLTPASSSTPSSTCWEREETPPACRQPSPPSPGRWSALWPRLWPRPSLQPLGTQALQSASTSPCMHVSEALCCIKTLVSAGGAVWRLMNVCVD